MPLNWPSLLAVDTTKCLPLFASPYLCHAITDVYLIGRAGELQPPRFKLYLPNFTSKNQNFKGFFGQFSRISAQHQRQVKRISANMHAPMLQAARDGETILIRKRHRIAAMLMRAKRKMVFLMGPPTQALLYLLSIKVFSTQLLSVHRDILGSLPMRKLAAAV